MPRNSSGTYSLPAGNPVTTLTTISSVWANTTLSDLATAMTDSLSRSGDGGMTAPLELTAGAVGTPGLTWSLETTSGLYRAGAGDFRYSISAADALQIVAGAVRVPDGTVGSPSVAFLNDNDTGMYRFGADQLGFATAGVLRLKLLAGAMDFSGTSQGLGPNGTAGSPSLSFASDPNTGFYSAQADSVGASAGGSLRFEIGTFGAAVRSGSLYLLDGDATNPGLRFDSDTNTGLFRVGADQIGITADGARVIHIVAASISGMTVRIDTGQLGMPDGSVTSPPYAFTGDPNTGFYRTTADQIAITLGGVTAGQIAQGSFTPTWTGFSAAPSSTVSWMIVGKHAFLFFSNNVGTSNATSMTITNLPAILQPATTQIVFVPSMTDNGVGINGGAVSVGASATMTFSILSTSAVANRIQTTTSGFTAANNKGVNSSCIAYSLL